jgi:hypothetical protein
VIAPDALHYGGHPESDTKIDAFHVFFVKILNHYLLELRFLRSLLLQIPLLSI